MNAESLTRLALDHEWALLSAVIIGLVIRLLKDDTRLPTIPSRYRVWAVIGLGGCSTGLERLASGVPWKTAALNGSFSVVLAIFGHDTIVRSLRSGREVPLPAFLLRKPDAADPSPEPETKPEAESESDVNPVVSDAEPQPDPQLEPQLEPKGESEDT